MILKMEIEYTAARSIEVYDPKRLSAFVEGAEWMQDRLSREEQPFGEDKKVELLRQDVLSAEIDAEMLAIGFLVDGKRVEPQRVVTFYNKPNGDKQNMEFDAAEKLALAYRKIQQTAIVDDDYEAVRYEYERAVNYFLQSCKLNGRKT